MAKDKTIFITCFFNLTVRNILETPFFEILRSKPNARIVLLVPEKNRDFFEKEFASHNVIIEAIKFQKLSGINLLFHLFSWHLLHTESKKIHKLVNLHQTKNYFVYILTSLISWFGQFGGARILFRWLDCYLVPFRGFDYLFEKYHPSIVFSTDIQDLRVQQLSDSYLIRAARRRGIKSVAMGRSWDSMTTKGLLRTLPDVLAVQNQNIKYQAIRYHGVSVERIAVVGTPHYDHYITGVRISRPEFFKKLKLDPNKKLIFVTPPSDIWTGDKNFNPYLLKFFADFGKQVVVRFPIFGGADLGGFKPPSFMAFDFPNNASQLAESLLRKSDDDHFADLIYHSDVVVTGPSSVILDASIFNKPVILIGFDGVRPRPFAESMTRYYAYEHQQLVIREGKLKIAASAKEMIDLVKFYLENPNADQGARKRVAESACFKLDGQSGKRLADLILKRLDI